MHVRPASWPRRSTRATASSSRRTRRPGAVGDRFRGVRAAGLHDRQGGDIVVFRPHRRERRDARHASTCARATSRSTRLVDYLGILGVVMLASLAVAALLSDWLQSAVTEPILEVARVAREVMERRDFALRARKTTEDEIGQLVDAFNAMLAEIGRRAEALREADRRKDEFLATLAHELRNPLAPHPQRARDPAARGQRPGEVARRRAR